MSIRSRLRSAALGACVFAACAASPSVQAAAAGATASGHAFGSFMIGCFTCPNADITMSAGSSADAGGPGARSAEVHYNGTGVSQTVTSDGVGGGASFDAAAAVGGPLGTPILRARASTDNESVFRQSISGPVFVGIDVYQASAAADLVQRYDFLGAVAETISFDFHLDGVLTGSLASLSAFAAFYDADDPFLEIALAANGTSAQGQLFQTGAVSEDFTVTMTFQPGHSYLLRSHLGAGVQFSYTTEDNEADAYHTMTVSAVRGNTSQLQAALLPTGGGTVPEPATPALLALGAAAAALARRRRG